ncbi:hypothetical protein WMW72_29870 [Paenibacillus filicis]|uniref:IrrE N-terminal-like domain-containing protein n=1 Tax=Paenibacillus filicis TaxID=669464 RepID=A0ABU9DTA0_9BACL
MRRYEALSYEIAHYLLQHEDGAQVAAAGALRELFQADDFFGLPVAGQTERVRKVTMKHALLVRKQAVCGTESVG